MFDVRLATLCLFLAPLWACTGIEDALRNWGEKERRTREQEISTADLETWRRDFQLSEERTRELYTSISDIVEESNLQGVLARKIAQAYMRKARYEEASRHYRAALGNRLPANEGQAIHYLEAALPWFTEALNRHIPDPDLLYEAGLCYANASRKLGWEEDRFRVAILLFGTLRRIKPEDTRAAYQLALLYAKVEDERLRDSELALKLLDEVLRQNDEDLQARFARAHILVANGDFTAAREEYGRILPALGENSPSRRQVRKNMDDLSLCVSGSPACPVR